MICYLLYTSIKYNMATNPELWASHYISHANIHHALSRDILLFARLIFIGCSTALVCCPMAQTTNGIMLHIPARQLCDGNLDKVMRNRSIVEFQHGLSKLITFVFRKQLDPDVVVYATSNKPGFYINQKSISARCKMSTYSPMPTTKYVPYQKLTSPPFAPPVGGYHGAASK